MYKNLNFSALAKFLGFSGLALLLGACSSSHLLVKKTDLAAAEQCLATQQKLVASNTAQQQQIAEALTLLQQSVVLQQERDELLRELASRPLFEEQRQQNCPPIGVAASGETELNKQIVGAHEDVLLVDANLIMSARIDTGSALSILDARDIQPFERNSEEWVRFNLIDPETQAVIEREHRRRIKPQGGGEETERRPVIELRVTLGQITQVAEFALADRSKQQYPMVIGRNVLRDLMLVDVGRSNVTAPQRPEADNGLEPN